MAVSLPVPAEPGHLGHHVHLGQIADGAVPILLEIRLIPAALGQHDRRFLHQLYGRLLLACLAAERPRHQVPGHALIFQTPSGKPGRVHAVVRREIARQARYGGRHRFGHVIAERPVADHLKIRVRGFQFVHIVT